MIASSAPARCSSSSATAASTSPASSSSTRWACESAWSWALRADPVDLGEREPQLGDEASAIATSRGELGAARPGEVDGEVPLVELLVRRAVARPRRCSRPGRAAHRRRAPPRSPSCQCRTPAPLEHRPRPRHTSRTESGSGLATRDAAVGLAGGQPLGDQHAPAPRARSAGRRRATRRARPRAAAYRTRARRRRPRGAARRRRGRRSRSARGGGCRTAARRGASCCSLMDAPDRLASTCCGLAPTPHSLSDCLTIWQSGRVRRRPCARRWPGAATT